MTTLIVSPHLDDEVLGCSSWFKEPDLHILYTTSTHPEAGEIVLGENKALQEEVGFTAHWTEFDCINGLDRIGQAPLINEVERLLNQLKPSVLLLPAPSYNQDHRACYEAGLTAARPHDRNWFVPGVLIYEEPETLGAMRKPVAFQPQHYRALDIAEKIRMYGIYVSQVREHRSSIHLRALAQVRGAQSNMDFAEAFEVARWVA